MLGESYTPFSDLLNMLGSNLRGWSKTAEVDRWARIIAHQVFMSSGATKIERILAISQWAIVKKQAAAPAYRYYEAEARNRVKEYTLKNAFTARNQGHSAISKSGDISRALNACMNELNNIPRKEAAYQIWLNNFTVALAEANNFVSAPLVLDGVYYEVNNGGWQEATGDIAVSVGDRLELQAFGIGYDSIQWDRDGTDVGNPGEEYLLISSVELTDAGDYTCTYSRAGNEAASPTVTVVVS